MKPVTMMRKAIRDHVNACPYKDYRWTATRKGLYWSYIDASFIFAYDKENEEASFTCEDTGYVAAMTVAPMAHKWMARTQTHLFGADADDCIYWAARRIMEYAEYIY